MPDKLWNEVHDIVQETGSKTIPKKKKFKKAKQLSEEALQIAMKRREAKSKGEKERYTHLNAELQRIARKDKKGFFSEQCKGIEGNNRMRKRFKGLDLIECLINYGGRFVTLYRRQGSIPYPWKRNAKK